MTNPDTAQKDTSSQGGEYPAPAGTAEPPPETSSPPADNGDNGKPSADKPPRDPVEEAEKNLKAAQKNLEAAKKQKAEDDAREKDLNAIHAQQATSKLIIKAVSDAQEKWAQIIEPQVTEADRSRIASTLDGGIAAVVRAEDRVDRLRPKASEDERDQKIKDVELAKLQKDYVEAQKTLSQFVARIKEIQARIEKRGAEVKSAIDAQDWSLAFGKNYHLGKEIEEAAPLLDSDKKEHDIIAKLGDLKVQVKNAETAATNAKDQLDKTNRDLKDAEGDLKKTRDSLEALSNAQ
jgi:hypothetical protein